MINKIKTIEKQLSMVKKAEFFFDDGCKTIITPTRFIPKLENTASQLTLNGTWKVQKWPFNTDEDSLISGECNCAEWDEVTQPGKVFYNDSEEIPGDVPKWNRVTLSHIDINDCAILKKNIDISADWKSKRIFLRFDAIYPAGRFYCNGKFLGEHLSGLTPVEFDVTDIVNPGETAVITVRLLRKHKYIQMDMPRHSMEFAGLSQDACLFAVEKIYIKDYHLIPELNDSFNKGVLKGEIILINGFKKEAHGRLEVSLKNIKNSDNVIIETMDVDMEGDSEKSLSVYINILNPDLWNDEYPNLYKVDIVLSMSEVREQKISYRTGFRRFELKDQRPLLNGNPVKFRGINHLTYHPEYGMYTPKEWLRQNLNLMKKANVNAIRTHFTSPIALAELCDEMGMYLMQELPIDWGHEYLYDPETVGPVLMRLEGAVRRDRNHPSLMVWSVGNENMPRNMQEYDDFMNHLHLFDEFVKTLDPSRPTMFPPPGPANKIEGIFETRIGDIGDTHYSFNLVRKFNKTGTFTSAKTWDGDMETFTRDEAIANGWSGVWFSSEYGINDTRPDLLNAPYTSIITDVPEDILSGKNSLQVFTDRHSREWGYMREDPTCLGGAYFPWLPAGAGDNPWGWVRWGEDANWGIVTADLLPKHQFWGMRVIFSPVSFPERISWKKGEKEISFEIANQYNSIDLSECTLRVMLNAGGKWMTMVRDWEDVPVSGAPGKTITVTIPLNHEGTLSGLENGNIALCRCIFLDPKGFSPITADILIIPAEIKESNNLMPIGPDAEL